MVQVLEPNESIFGRIGTGIGQGLSESIPKEVERYRMAQGLQTLSQNAKNQTPLQNYLQALQTPGVTPEMAQNIEKYIQQQNVRDAKPIGAKPVGAKGGAPVKPGKPAPGQPEINQKKAPGAPDTKITQDSMPGSPVIKIETKPGEPEPKQKPGRAPTILEAAPTRGPEPQMSYDQKEDRAYQIYEQQPDRFPNGFTDALPIVEQELKAEREAWQAEKNARVVDQQLEKDYDSAFTNILTRNLQKEKGVDTYGPLPGRIQTVFRERGLDRVAKGESPESAAAAEAQAATAFAERRNLLAKYGYSTLSETPEETVKALKLLRDDYAELDALDIFVDDMKNKNGLGDHLASTIAYDLSPEVAKVIPKYSQISHQGDWEEQLAQKIANRVTQGDSLFTIGLDLHEKGYKDQPIMDKIIKNLEKRRSYLPEHQKKEMGSYYGLDYTLGDIIFSHISESFGKMGKIPAYQKSRIKFWGKK